MLALAEALCSAAAAADWAALAKADAALEPALAKLAAHGPWHDQERAALAALRGAHEQARRGCAQAKARIDGQLREMLDNKEGWIAYALYSETDPNGNQA